jgi:hypothetical protein
MDKRLEGHELPFLAETLGYASSQADDLRKSDVLSFERLRTTRKNR